MNSRDKIISENLLLKRERKQICVNKLRPEYCVVLFLVRAMRGVRRCMWVLSLGLSRRNYIITKSIYI